MLWRKENAWGHKGNGTRDDFKAFIRKQIDSGKPLISLGPVGPAEAGIITGYRNDGDTLLGWSFFQYDATVCNGAGDKTDLVELAVYSGMANRFVWIPGS